MHRSLFIFFEFKQYLDSLTKLMMVHINPSKHKGIHNILHIVHDHIHNIHHREDKDQPWDQQQVQVQQTSSFCPNIPDVHKHKDIHNILVHVHNTLHTEDKDQLWDQLQVQQQVLLQQIFSFCPNIHIPDVHNILHMHMDIYSSLHTKGRDQLLPLQKDQLQQWALALPAQWLPGGGKPVI